MKKAGLFLLILAVLIVGFAMGRTRVASAPSAPRRILYYVDSMHPAYRSAKPGLARIVACS